MKLINMYLILLTFFEKEIINKETLYIKFNKKRDVDYSVET